MHPPTPPRSSVRRFHHYRRHQRRRCRPDALVCLLLPFLAAFPPRVYLAQSFSPRLVSAPPPVLRSRSNRGEDPFLCAGATLLGDDDGGDRFGSPSSSVSSRGWRKRRRTAAAGRLRQHTWLSAVGVDSADVVVNGDREDALSSSVSAVLGDTDRSLEYLAGLIRSRLEVTSPSASSAESESESESESSTDREIATVDGKNSTPHRLAGGRFIDMTTTIEGEQVLESLFAVDEASSETTDPSVAQGAIVALQSLCVLGMQIGVKGPLEAQEKMVRHLFRRGDVNPKRQPSGTESESKTYAWSETWTRDDSVRRLKFFRDSTLGIKVLAALARKRTAQGAFDLLLELGAWGRHEDTALLRSGFPTRFSDDELVAAIEAENNDRDPDTILGIRQDLRHHKVYTIDGASTMDIDDGLSVEALPGINSGDGGEEGSDTGRHRLWIHIADVDRWAPRGSELLKVAERRSTSLYLPDRSLAMFPPNMSMGVMSLESNRDRCALSLGAEIRPDGSIDPASIILMPSTIRVDYRLTYDQVDEMLDEGVGYTEEWQIGLLLKYATMRRAHRVEKGSTEGMVPHPIPKGVVTATRDENSNDNYDISLNIETTHNSGVNRTSAVSASPSQTDDPYASPVSSSQLIVTEMMIMAGEAIGKWQQRQSAADNGDGSDALVNELKLPYRRQPPPDWKMRTQDVRHMNDLLTMGHRYPHAWYARRFFKPVAVNEEPGSHFGMGLDCYVQFSSPIRRITDLQVHAAMKRYLRRKRVNEMIREGTEVPLEITEMDLGCHLPSSQQGDNDVDPVDPIDYTSGLGMIFAGRPIQSSSSTYWMFENIRRKVDESVDEVMFECEVLGCVNYERMQYAIYVYELGLEHRYLSQVGELVEGEKLWLKVVDVSPRMGLLTFSLASKSGGIHAQPMSAPA